MPQHILQLPENRLGNDYILGDVHGSYVFFSVIKKLKEHDRLFIVGDLIDRGPCSFEIVQRIIEINKVQQKIYVVLGNHEISFCRFFSTPETDSNRKKYYNFHIQPAMGGDWIKEKSVEELKLIFDYFQTLPCIILVGSFEKKEDAFLICHAHMPFSDEALQERIAKDVLLEKSDIWDLVEARPEDIRVLSKNRSSQSIRVYCGHNAMQSKYQEDDMKFFISRMKDANHINLDCDGSASGTFVLVNHTKKSAKYVQLNVNEGSTDLISSIIHHLNRFLRKADFFYDQLTYISNLVGKLAVSRMFQFPFLGSNNFAKKKYELTQAVNDHLRLKRLVIRRTVVEEKTEEILSVVEKLKEEKLTKASEEILNEIEDILTGKRIIGDMGKDFVNVDHPQPEGRLAGALPGGYR